MPAVPFRVTCIGGRTFKSNTGDTSNDADNASFATFVSTSTSTSASAKNSGNFLLSPASTSATISSPLASSRACFPRHHPACTLQSARYEPLGASHRSVQAYTDVAAPCSGVFVAHQNRPNIILINVVSFCSLVAMAPGCTLYALPLNSEGLRARYFMYRMAPSLLCPYDCQPENALSSKSGSSPIFLVIRWATEETATMREVSVVSGRSFCVRT